MNSSNDWLKRAHCRTFRKTTWLQCSIHCSLVLLNSYLGNQKLVPYSLHQTESKSRGNAAMLLLHVSLKLRRAAKHTQKDLWLQNSVSAKQRSHFFDNYPQVNSPHSDMTKDSSKIRQEDENALSCKINGSFSTTINRFSKWKHIRTPYVTLLTNGDQNNV